MRAWAQIVTIAVIGLAAVPLSARFVPGVQPWLDRVGLLQPLTAAGIVPAGAADAPEAQKAKTGAGGIAVVAAEVPRRPLQTVISAIGSARGVQAVDLSFGVTGRLTALPGARVNPGDVIAMLVSDSAELAANRARLVLQDAQKTVSRLEQLAQSGTATALQRQDAELALRTAELGLLAAERDLADHRLLAPVAGYVGLIEPQIGDLVTPTTTITRIEDRSALIVDFRVPEGAAARVAVGDVLQVRAISATAPAISGKIIAVDNRVDEASRSLRVQALIENTDDRLRAGMAFEITLSFDGDSYPAVDPLAIQWGADGAFVWVVRDAAALQLPVQILQRNADAVLIDADLAPGDLVVTEGVQALRPKADVTVTAPRS